MRWLFDHDPATKRALDGALSPHHGRASIEAALRELVRFGLLALNHAAFRASGVLSQLLTLPIGGK